MFNKLKEINSRPLPFEFYTASELWTNEHTAQKMLEYHLNPEIEASSRSFAFIEESVNWMVHKLKLNSSSRIIDFGCGPGLYTTKFAEMGIKVSGIDFSQNSINYAKKTATEKKLEINYFTQNYLEFQTKEKFDLIIMIMCDFCALSPKQRSLLLKKFKSILSKNGRIILDVFSSKAFAEREEYSGYEFNQMDNFWAKEDYYCFTNTFKYEKEKVVLDKYTICEEKRTKIVYNWLQYFTKDSLQEEFEKNGLQIDEFFDNVAGKEFSDSGNEIAIIAK